MSPDMLIGLALSGILILLFGQSPQKKERRKDKRYRKTIATLVLSGSSGEIEIIKDLNSAKESRTIKSKVNHVVVTEALLQTEHKKFINIFVIYCLSFIFKVIIDLLIDLPIESTNIFVVLSIPVILLFIRNKIFEYRITKGLYGTNSYEARNLIRFIERNADMFDDSDGGPGHRVFSETDLNDQAQTIRIQEKGLGELS